MKFEKTCNNSKRFLRMLSALEQRVALTQKCLLICMEKAHARRPSSEPTLINDKMYAFFL